MTALRCLALGIALLTLAGCTNAGLVRVCDPCGCQCVAEPLVTQKGEIPRGDDGEKEAAKAEPGPVPKTELDVDHVLHAKRIRNLVWEDVDLDHAVAYLQTITGVDFYISPRVREEKFDDVVISLHLDTVSADMVLEVITKPFGMRWEVRDTVVHILTPEELDGKVRLRYFDVRDLCPAKKAPPASVAGRPAPESVGDPAAAESLLAEIRDEVFPRYWEENDAVMEVRNGIVIMRAPKAVLEAVDQFLAAKRQERQPYEMPAKVRQKLDETKLSISIKKEKLGDVIRILQVQTGMNLMIDPRYAADVEDSVIVGLDMKDTPLSTVMNMVAAAAGEDARWVAKQNVLILTRKEFMPVR